MGSTGVPATSGVTLTYGTTSAQNNNGRLITVIDGVGRENYSYDILGRVTQLQKVIGTTTYTTSLKIGAKPLIRLRLPKIRRS